MKVVKGNTVKEQIEHIDRILKSYSYKLHKTVIGIITPFPISCYSETIDGPVLRYMFPANGKITIGGLYVEKMPKDGIDIHVTIFDGTNQNSQVIFSKKSSIAVEVNAKVSSGSRLLININPVSKEETASGIWIAFLWIPEIKDSGVEQFLINTLENVGKRNALC